MSKENQKKNFENLLLHEGCCFDWNMEIGKKETWMVVAWISLHLYSIFELFQTLGPFHLKSAYDSALQEEQKDYSLCGPAIKRLWESCNHV